MAYLDYAATTPVLAAVAQVVNKYMCDTYGNPSSRHHLGVEAEKAVLTSAQIIGKQLNCKADSLFFTSSGTESNQTVIINPRFTDKRTRHFITTQVEHPSVLRHFETLERLGHQVTYLATDAYGAVTVEQVMAALTAQTALISVIYVNNELGTTNDIAAIGRALAKVDYQGIFHTDATQALAKFPIDLQALKVDALTASAHKFHGPKGVGLLYLKKPQRFSALMLGGGQQAGLRVGTYNVPGIAGMAMALKLSTASFTENAQRIKRIDTLITDHFAKPQTAGILLGHAERKSPYIYAMAFAGVKAEVLLHALETEGYYVSSGSACSSHHKQSHSHVLEAIKLDRAYIDGVIRISLSYLTTEDTIKNFLASLDKVVRELQRIGEYS